MWQTLTEIKTIFDNHNYNFNNIILDNFKKFKLKSAFNKYGFTKTQGFPLEDIVIILMLLPLLSLNTIHHLYKKHYNHIATMQKDTLYRFINNESTDWRRILLHVAKMFDSLTNSKTEIHEKSALILDDTSHLKTGATIEKISYVFDHVLRKSVLGFKNLTLAHFDGISYKVVDFSLHSEKKLSIKKRKKQYKSKVTTGSKAHSRIKECNQDKISNGIKMIKRAAKNGFKFKYVLTDSWFVCEKTIKEIRKIKNGEIHLFGAVRKDRRKYSFLNKELNANELLNELKTMNGCKGKRNRKNNYHYYEAICIYKGIPIRLFFAKGKHQRHWKLFLTTDTTANFNKFCEIYSIRWGIEVIFKECKCYLKMGKCMSRTFAAQIADISMCYILYNMLVYQKRIGDYKTTGSLFEYLGDDLIEKTVAEKIGALMLELLEFIIEKATIETGWIHDYNQLKSTASFKETKQLFENSFLTSFLKDVQ